MQIQPQTIHLGHHDVENDQIRSVLNGSFESRFSVSGFDKFMTFFAQQKSDEFHHILFIIHNQNASHRTSFAPSTHD